MKSLVRRALRMRTLAAVMLLALTAGAASAVAALFVDAPALWVVAIIATALALLTLQATLFLVLRNVAVVRRETVDRLKNATSGDKERAAKVVGQMNLLSERVAKLDVGVGHLASAMHTQVEELDRRRLERVVSERRLEDRLVQTWEEWAYDELGPRLEAGRSGAVAQDEDSGRDA